MAGRAIRTDRLIAVLGVAVLALGAVLLWVTVRNGGVFTEPSPSERALRQLREQMGPDVEIQYLEIGKGRAVCGYAGSRRGSSGPAFISRPNRLLLDSDPLQTEFNQMLGDVCPGFIKAPLGVY
ncbi:MAG: hypothetical protein Q8O54_02415 [Brevundimonas sp.]|nr:hypothetical protein [Brevundimonas sp.]